MTQSSSFGNRSDFWWLFISSLVFFLLVVIVYVREYSSDWLPVQRHFRQVLEQHGQLTAAREFQFGVKQLWIPALDRVDRCVTCHLGYEWGEILSADLPQPFASHPPLPYLDEHPFPRFGCTSCHGGQGYATETKAAHGEIQHWEEPLLSAKLASEYGLSRRELMQVLCNACHRHDRETPGMELIDLGKKTFDERGCIACHIVSGEGGLTGPELTYEGDKNPEFLDFTRVDGRHTAMNWHIRHFRNPQEVVEASAMPDLGFTEEEVKSLALLMVGWRRESFPPEYIPPSHKLVEAGVLPMVRDVPVPPGEQMETRMEEEGQRLFRARGCYTCHTVGQGKLIGPDLRGIAERRSEEWLSNWLADPAAMLRATTDLQAWPQEYGGIIMPNQNLATTDIQALIAYMRTF